MRSYRLRIAGAVCAVVLGLTAADCDSSSGTSGGTSGGGNGGVVEETRSSQIFVNVDGMNCIDGGTVTVRVSGSEGKTLYGLDVRFPANTHQEATVKSRTVESDNHGDGKWAFTCKGMKKGSYVVVGTDQNTGAKAKGYFDVLR